MFDIGFSELMIIAVVALIVIGPEKLPKVARTAGHLFGRMQRYVNDVKADISREMALDDLRKLQASMQETAQSLEQSVNDTVRSAESEMNRIAGDAPPADGGSAAASAVAETPAVAEKPAATDPAKPA
ncbi:MAG: Sec-independent protein translocase protein TatB [Burkholderiales bacterium]|nr:Sec-independent protein translocase protein TatB [Burkholderiales bacterium]MDP2399158.1 Sec-independent protein translocase protein TatB [Burkholderiales bacterium]